AVKNRKILLRRAIEPPEGQRAARHLVVIVKRRAQEVAMTGVPFAVADVDCRERSGVNVTGIRAGTREALEERYPDRIGLVRKAGRELFDHDPSTQSTK